MPGIDFNDTVYAMYSLYGEKCLEGQYVRATCIQLEVLALHPAKSFIVGRNYIFKITASVKQTCGCVELECTSPYNNHGVLLQINICDRTLTLNLDSVRKAELKNCDIDKYFEKENRFRITSFYDRDK